MNIKILKEFIRLCAILGVEPTPVGLYDYKNGREDIHEIPTYNYNALGY